MSVAFNKLYRKSKKGYYKVGKEGEDKTEKRKLTFPMPFTNIIYSIFFRGAEKGENRKEKIYLDFSHIRSGLVRIKQKFILNLIDADLESCSFLSVVVPASDIVTFSPELTRPGNIFKIFS